MFRPPLTSRSQTKPQSYRGQMNVLLLPTFLCSQPHLPHVCYCCSKFCSGGVHTPVVALCLQKYKKDQGYPAD